MAPSWNTGVENHQKVYSSKHKKTGLNLQILTGQTGGIYYVSNPIPGSRHDINALRQTNLLDNIPPDRITADKNLSVPNATFPSAGNLTQTYKIGNNGLTKASDASATPSNEQ